MFNFDSINQKQLMGVIKIETCIFTLPSETETLNSEYRPVGSDTQQETN